MEIPSYVAYSPDDGKRVQVYRNLTRNCWSVRHKGRVIAHAMSVYLKDAVFKVQEGGRRRVLKERRKNVHAFVEGYGTDDLGACESALIRVVYNPYAMSTFETVLGASVRSAKYVWLKSGGPVFAHEVAA